MRRMMRWVTAVVILGVALSAAGQAQAAAPQIAGKVLGVELLPQFGSHGALFLFAFGGTLDGRPRTGWGWIEVKHDPLPDEGDYADITGGEGSMSIGLRRFDIDVIDGTLYGEPDDLFDVKAALKIGSQWGGFADHAFAGWLSHQTFPPTIGGSLTPAP
jgi:hypothetical protein